MEEFAKAVAFLEKFLFLLGYVIKQAPQLKSHGEFRTQPSGEPHLITTVQHQHHTLTLMSSCVALATLTQ